MHRSSRAIGVHVMKLNAYAKINLTLEVLGKRADGFHEVATVLHTIDLADELTLEPAPTLSLTGDDAGTLVEENLVMRAARLLQQALGEKRGARILLTKHIPVAAGLGGGSTDAATTLAGLARLWQREVSAERLAELAATLGSDVPFFLTGGAGLGEGRGEIITPLPSMHETWLVLTTPQVTLDRKTARLYGAMRPSMYTQGEATATIAEVLRRGDSVTAAHVFNVFDAVADEVYPDFRSLRVRLAAAAGSAVHLAGSGPTLFTMVASEADTAAVHRRWAAVVGAPTHVAKTVARST